MPRTRETATAIQATDIHGAAFSRRGFLVTGGALIVALSVKPGSAMADTANTIDPAQPASWIEIHADNTVLIRTGKCDFGQSSIYTAYRQIVAEELDMPMSAMTTVISGDTDRTPDGGGTFGLLRQASGNMRKAAAYTREAALALAAQKFGVPRAALSIRDGVISGGGKSTTYGELVAGQDFRLTIPTEGDLNSPFGLRVSGNPPLKPVADYRIVGQPVTNPSLRPKLAGETVWVGDVKLPGMVHARTIHPATLGSTLVSAGKVDAAQFPGARVVTIANLVAVVSENEWEALQAAQQVAADTKWTAWAGLPGHDKLFDHLRKAVDWTAYPVRKGRANKGDVAAAGSGKVLQASYSLPYHKHAPIGPMVSLADVKPDGSVTLHTLSQNAQHLRRMIAKMLGSSEAQVVVRTYPGPGHFGRSNGGSAGSEDEAVLLSRELGKPVRVQWMRADDMQWSSQSPAAISDIRITLDGQGRIAAYQADHRGPPMQDDRLVGALLAGLPVIDAPSAETTYGFQSGVMNVADAWVYGTIGNVAEQGHGTPQIGQKESPLAVGLRDHSMRTPVQFQQNFPREVAISEAAALAGADPLQFRLDHVDSPRFKAILNRLRDEASWVTRPSPAPGAKSRGSKVVKGQGVSIMLRDNGYWACAAHIAVTPATGEVKVERLTIVADPGVVVNPLQLRRQIQAGSLMGVSQALHEEVSFDKGAITSTDWASYPILTIGEMPEVKVVIAGDSTDGVYGQGSESANALASPAIAAAFFDATGKPARSIPLRPDHVKRMLAG
ncbi:MAG: xanthine dehydrogenase family protein molybdopterin-binding subunit [Sphingomonadales bacterium]|nr:xanthine dehydrogenase family protein molybdopterin-binding subunit [Sphingomonadales bacterium]